MAKKLVKEQIEEGSETDDKVKGNKAKSK